tara:strand:+ start:3520 stop:3732 length:213 start_codon:yes stop_codon:yes gene_type:complete
MKIFITGFSLLLSLVAILLVMNQVDLLQTTGKSNTTGGLNVFFDTPVFLVLAVGGAICVASVFAVFSKIR